MVQAATLLPFAVLAVTAPTELLRRTNSGFASGYEPTTTQYEATFDDLEPVAGGLISLQPVGPYDGLDYEGISKHIFHEFKSRQLTPQTSSH